jgi:hypothetical protein
MDRRRKATRRVSHPLVEFEMHRSPRRRARGNAPHSRRRRDPLEPPEPQTSQAPNASGVMSLWKRSSGCGSLHALFWRVACFEGSPGQRQATGPAGPHAERIDGEVARMLVDVTRGGEIERLLLGDPGSCRALRLDLSPLRSKWFCSVHGGTRPQHGRPRQLEHPLTQAFIHSAAVATSAQATPHPLPTRRYPVRSGDQPAS